MGSEKSVQFRLSLHPRMNRLTSNYPSSSVAAAMSVLSSSRVPVWCMFHAYGDTANYAANVRLNNTLIERMSTSDGGF